MSPKSFDVKEIVNILPHRYPFLLVDKIIDIDLEKGTILGQKNVSYNEQFFQGHFPGSPIMPGVLILEALAQTGAVLVYLNAKQDKIAVLLNVKEAKFRKSVHPGDVLQLYGEGIHLSSKGGKVLVRATVDGKVAVQAEVGFAFVDRDQV